MSDGVVPYWSSHMDTAESELIVPSGHDAHQNPQAIAEVERILKYMDANFAADRFHYPPNTRMNTKLSFLSPRFDCGRASSVWPRTTRRSMTGNRRRPTRRASNTRK
jgi:hypothetical protein